MIIIFDPDFPSGPNSCLGVVSNDIAVELKQPHKIYMLRFEY